MSSVALGCSLLIWLLRIRRGAPYKDPLAPPPLSPLVPSHLISGSFLSDALLVLAGLTLTDSRAHVSILQATHASSLSLPDPAQQSPLPTFLRIGRLFSAEPAQPPDTSAHLLRDHCLGSPRPCWSPVSPGLGRPGPSQSGPNEWAALDIVQVQP